MKLLTILSLLFLSACSTQVVEMAAVPTPQQFDLSDSEGDGIITARDNCPNSVHGSQIDNDGCSDETIETVRQKLEVNFDFDSYFVKTQYLSRIETLAQLMTEYPQATLLIEGHTSIRGGAEHNLVLSKNRAEAIKTTLSQQFSIAPERIDTIGYGFEKLLVEGNNEVAHARNRRIVAALSIDKVYTDMKWHIYSVENKAE